MELHNRQTADPLAQMTVEWRITVSHAAGRIRANMADARALLRMMRTQIVQSAERVKESRKWGARITQPGCLARQKR